MSEYFDSIKKGVSSVVGGMSITLKHLANATRWREETTIMDDDNYFNKLNEGLVTIQYPSEAIPTPEFARYRLHNDANDCIACNQCANACPVNCITIESFKATPDDMEELGTTSDGSKKKLWLSRFDIDMAKCMYCGLCTYPCPTECLTMTPVHDFAEVDRANFIYHFSVLTKEKEAEKRAKLAKYEEEEKAKKAAAPKAAPATGARVSPLMAKKAAASADATAEAPKAEPAPAPEAQPAKKLPPMMAAKLAAKKAAAEGGATQTPEAKAEPAQSETPKAEGDAQPAKKLPPMMAAKLAAKKAAEEAAKKQAEGDGQSTT
ncbi:MAG: NADH-quinone oxidoreductase subunit I [Chloroherpetonaceae bacterium]|nr:NADH-quinone oxidoreductase subunit I [Chloroherpetonaceae bacterium]MDW8437242.1 NADH-quinone oxidoreductase subunit I [Chloroherpetonaceae bacterium]